MSNLAYTPPNTAALNKQATKEVDQEIKSQVDPLQTLVDQYDTQSQNAQSGLNNFFTNPTTGVQTAANQSAQRVASYYEMGNNATKGVWNEAMARLNTLQQERGAQAQKLAQQIGAPIPISMFTDPVAAETQLGIYEGAGSMLKGIGLAQAGVQQAEAFAGQVFPLLRTRLNKEIQNYFGDKITAAQKEIASIKGQRGGLITKRQRELLLQEREFKLTKLQADRDWWLAKQNNDLNRKEMGLRIAQLEADIADDIADNKRDQAKITAAKTAKKELALTTARDNALKYLEAYMSPGTSQIKVSQLKPDGSGYETVLVTVPNIQDLANDPNALLNTVLTSAGVNKGNPTKNAEFRRWFIGMMSTRARALGLEWAKGSWVEGQGTGSGKGGTVTNDDVTSGGYAKPALTAMPLKTLERIAIRDYGFKGGYPAKVKSNPAKMKQWLVDWYAQQQSVAIATGALPSGVPKPDSRSGRENPGAR